MSRIKDSLRRLLPDRAWTWLRVLNLRWMVLAYRRRVVEHAYGPHRLKVYLSDPLAEGWYDHDWPALREIGVLKARRLRPGAMVFDIGAHQGIVALMLAAEVGDGGRVIAVEAHPHNVSAALRNCRLNGAGNVVVIHAAVTDHGGQVVVSRSLNADVDTSGAWGRQRVPALTIDDLARRFGWPDVVYLDIEGHEVAAVRAATGTLAHDTDWLIEVHTQLLDRYGGSIEDLINCFPTDRFELLWAPEGAGAFEHLDVGGAIEHPRLYLLASCRSGPGSTAVRVPSLEPG